LSLPHHGVRGRGNSRAAPAPRWSRACGRGTQARAGAPARALRRSRIGDLAPRFQERKRHAAPDAGRRDDGRDLGFWPRARARARESFELREPKPRRYLRLHRARAARGGALHPGQRRLLVRRGLVRDADGDDAVRGGRLPRRDPLEIARRVPAAESGQPRRTPRARRARSALPLSRAPAALRHRSRGPRRPRCGLGLAHLRAEPAAVDRRRGARSELARRYLAARPAVQSFARAFGPLEHQRPCHVAGIDRGACGFG
jgi:hypothetical protein